MPLIAIIAFVLILATFLGCFQVLNRMLEKRDTEKIRDRLRSEERRVGKECRL